MNLTDITTIQSDSSSPIEIIALSESVDGVIYINNYAVCPVLRVNQSYDSSNVIDITLNGGIEGHLILKKGENEIVSAMPELEFIAFLSEANYSDYENGEYEFKKDYLIVKDSFYSDYKAKYYSSAPIWGGFSHEKKISEPTGRHQISIQEIEIGDELKALDDYSYESAVRAIEQPYAFERFLKLYHLLELQFDYFLIEKIKALTIPQDSNLIGQMLNNYSKSELVSLTKIIEHHCLDISSLEKKLELVLPHRGLAEEIFINFSKSSKGENKLLTKIDKFNAVFNASSFSQATYVSNKIATIAEYDNAIHKLVAFWIYKIRCSIAHNKIGEYLLSWDNENFIVDFAEPLLKEVLKQCFKK